MARPFPPGGGRGTPQTPAPPPRIDPNSTDVPPASTASTSSAWPQSSISTSRALEDFDILSDPWPAGPSDGSAYPDAGSARANPRFDDIEMDPIAPAGHRRRRSSLMNPAAKRTGSSRPRAQSFRNQLRGQEEPKITEEGNEMDSIRTDGWANDSFSDEDLHDDEEAGLTAGDKRRKQRQKRRNTQLDQRVVRERITTEEKKEADQTVARKLVVNGVLIGLWYLFSLCISLYNKWMFDKNQLNFPFPLFTTASHMLVQFSLASLTLYFIPSLRPHNGHRSNNGQSRHDSEPDKPIMSKSFYLTRIAPCGVATGLDIGLGNTSLKFITLTFYTMCKSSSLGFVLIFAFLFRLESPTWRLVGIIATMTVGVVMMVAGEVEFQLGGFLLVISAAFFSGFRWALTQILLLRNPATSNPFASIFFLAPVMFLSLIVIAIPAEGVTGLLGGIGTLAEEWGVFLTPLLLLFPGVIAFLMTAAEFALLQRTSVVTLSIAGIFKEAVTISAAAIVFGDTLTAVNVSGLFVTIAAIATYNWIKIAKMRRDAQAEARRGHMAGSKDTSLDGFASPSNSGGDDGGDDEDGGEETGLLRHSTDGEDNAWEDNAFTVDGDATRQPISADRVGEHNKSDRDD